MSPAHIAMIKRAQGHLGTAQRYKRKTVEQYFLAGELLLTLEREGARGALTVQAFFSQHFPEHADTTLYATMKMVNDCGTVEEAHKRGGSVREINWWLVQQERKAAAKAAAEQADKLHPARGKKGSTKKPVDEDLKKLDRLATKFLDEAARAETKVLVEDGRANWQMLNNTASRVANAMRKLQTTSRVALHKHEQEEPKFNV